MSIELDFAVFYLTPATLMAASGAALFVSQPGNSNLSRRLIIAAPGMFGAAGSLSAMMTMATEGKVLDLWFMLFLIFQVSGFTMIVPSVLLFRGREIVSLVNIFVIVCLICTSFWGIFGLMR